MRRTPKIYATDIKWETDSPQSELQEPGHLPDRMEVPEDVWKNGSLDDISDWLSDETGFLHDGFAITSDMTVEEMRRREDETKKNLATCPGGWSGRRLSHEKRLFENAIRFVEKDAPPVEKDAPSASKRLENQRLP